MVYSDDAAEVRAVALDGKCEVSLSGGAAGLWSPGPLDPCLAVALALQRSFTSVWPLLGTYDSASVIYVNHIICPGTAVPLRC